MANSNQATKTVTEPARKTGISYEADVVVVGGGPGGHSAAVAAARSGAKTVLIERYGHLGGMPTGGLVTMLHNMSDGTSQQVIAGLCQEWIDRLDVRGAVVHPRKEEIGTTDEKVLDRWSRRFFALDGHLTYGARFEAEILKCVLNDMVEESGVKLYLHSWGTQIILDRSKRAQGVIFESKSGRQAVLAKVVIDSTGDGDFLPQAGEDFDVKSKPTLRLDKPSLCFEFANVDLKKANDFKVNQPQQYTEMTQKIIKFNGFPTFLRTTREDTIHFNMFLEGYDVLKVEDLTRIEIDVRKRMLTTYEFYKKYYPGFENCFIMVTAPQIGCRGSRRMVGEYMLTVKDAASGEYFDDTIAVFPPLDGALSKEHPHLHVPFRCLLPRKTENMLVAGRMFSSDDVINEHYNTISHCTSFGQAAGTAAALAAKKGVSVRKVDIHMVQDNLLKQGVPLPGLKR
jgi:FAD dependent oxidoreductase